MARVKELKSIVSRSRESINVPASINADVVLEDSKEWIKKLEKLKRLSEDDKEILGGLQSKLDENRKELENRNITIQAIQRNFQVLSNSFQVEHAELEILRTRTAQDKDQIRTLQYRLDQAEAKAALFEAAVPELESLRAKAVKDAEEILALHTKLDDSAHRLRSLQETVMGLEKAQAGLSQTQQANFRMSRELAETQSELRKVRENYEIASRQCDTLNTQCAKLEEACSEFKAHGEKLTKDLESLRIAHSHNQRVLTDSESKLNARARENDDLQQQLMQLSKISEGHQRRVQELEQRVVNLQIQAKESDTRHAQELHKKNGDIYKEHQQTVEKIVADYEEKLSRNAEMAETELQRRMQEAQEETQCVRDDASKRQKELERRLREIENKAQAMTTEVDTVRRQLADARKLNEDLVQKAGSAAAAVSSQDAELRRTIRGLEDQLLRSNSEADQKQSSLLEQLQRCKNEVDQKQMAVSELREQVKRLTAEKLALEDSSRVSRKQVEEAHRESTSVRNQLQETESRLNALLAGKRDESLVKAMKQELTAALAKLKHAEEATESSISCMVCLNPFIRPVVCSPCGHSYCASCIQRNQNCPECGDLVRDMHHCENLDVISSKQEYKRQALAALIEMAKKLGMSTSFTTPRG